MNRDFFGMMFQGSSVDLQGNVQQPYFPIPVGVVRLWDTFAVMTFLGESPPFNLQGLHSQVALAERLGARVLYTFGFSGDPAFPPPQQPLLPGSRNRPTREYMELVVDAILGFSLAGGARRIQMYELWNEPAIDDLYWDAGTIPECVESMRSFAGWLYGLIKSRDPLALVLSPSLNDLLEPSGFDFALRYCELMRTRGHACDGIAFHMYAKDVKDIYAQLDTLQALTHGMGMAEKLYCTEYNGPWEAADIFAARGIKLWTLNGQQRAPDYPPPPYEDSAQAGRWMAMVDRILSAKPLAERKGCNFLRR